MKTDIIYTEGQFNIRKHDGIPEEAYQFLDSISWGTEGALYEHKNTKERIKQIKKPILMGIYEGDQLRATAVFVSTTVTETHTPYNLIYIRYFASSKAIRGKGIIKRFSIKVMALIRELETEPTIYMGCVEKDNKSSYKVVQSAGYSKFGTVKTQGFSRFFPRWDQRIEQVKHKEAQNEVLDLLKQQYEHHALVQFDYLFIKDNYYVIREQGKIVAGCQYHRAHWVINNMKGVMGKIVMKVVPLIPMLNTLFNPKRFEFLAFEGVYFKPGYEAQLHTLFEGLLAKEHLKSAMFWLGETCPIRATLLKKGKLGLLHRFVKDSDIEIMTSFKNINASEIANMKSKPLYASAFDFI